MRISKEEFNPFEIQMIDAITEKYYNKIMKDFNEFFSEIKNTSLNDDEIVCFSISFLKTTIMILQEKLVELEKALKV